MRRVPDGIVPRLSSLLQKPLLEVLIHTTPETEEAVAGVFENVFEQSPAIYLDLEKRTTMVSVFVEAFSREQRVLLQERLPSIAQPGAKMKRVRVRRLPRENWAESWKRHFKPLEISPRLLVLPSWSKRKPRRGQVVVILDPGLSFGTGHHPTTSFCLEQIASLHDGNRKQRLLDAGCGSGILSIAAARLGYSTVTAFDFDPDAVRVARENARLNRVRFQVSQRDLTQLLSRSRQRFDVVCANITYDLLVEHRHRILGRLAPRGVLVLAGILKEQFPKVQRAYESEGLKLIAARAAKEWKSGAFRAALKPNTLRKAGQPVRNQ